MSKHRYRSKKTIDAIQWMGDNTEEIKEFLGENGHGYEMSPSGKYMQIGTDWGTVSVAKADFVTLDGEGHVSNNSPATFATYYERLQA